MAYGNGDDDAALRAAWQQFCARLQQAGERVFKDANPANPLQRADALRFLTQNLGQAFDLALETRDTRYPQLHDFCNPNRKLGSDCADFVYLQAWIDGSSTYKVSGNIGSARFLNFTVQGARPERQPGSGAPSLSEPFGDLPQANLFGHQLQTDAQGNFDLHIGGPPRPENWLPTTAESRKLFVRQGFDHWDERPATLSIERIDMREPRPLPTPAVMIEAIDWAGRFMLGTMDDWPEHPYRYSAGVVDPAQPNRFPDENDGDTAADRKRGRAVAHLCWELAADEALIIEFIPPDGFWSLTNMGAFFNSMDYLYRPVSYTPSRSAVDADGRVRMILCDEDPGYHNWIDTQGFARGNLSWRLMLSQQTTRFRTRLVKREALAAALPADAARVTPEQRVTQLQQRFAAIRQRYRL